MDKYEFKLKVDEMKALVSARNYNAAAEIAETINWRKIRNLNALVLAGEVFEQVGRYEDSKEILLLAYDKSPIGRNIIYRLAEISIKTGRFDEAQEYYDEFVDIAPHDNLKFVLKYKMTAAQGLPYKEQIKILEELKEQEYSEEWAYELAYLYHKDMQPEKCVEACDELILWFGDGIYVEKALELKMHYQPLTKPQEEKYHIFRQKRTGVIEVKPNDFLESGEIVHEAVEIPSVQTNMSQYNTANLQKEIAKGMQQIGTVRMQKTRTNTSQDAEAYMKQIQQEPLEQQIWQKSQTQQGPLMQQTWQKSQNQQGLPPQQTWQESQTQQEPLMQQTWQESQNQQEPLVQQTWQESQNQQVPVMTMEEIQAEWERTKQAMSDALHETEGQEQEESKEKSLDKAEQLMQRLLGIVPQLAEQMAQQEISEQRTGTVQQPVKVQNDLEQAGVIVAGINQLLQEQIDRLTAEETPKPAPAIQSVSDPTRELPRIPENMIEGKEIGAIEKVRMNGNSLKKNLSKEDDNPVMSAWKEAVPGISAIDLLQRVRMEKTAAGSTDQLQAEHTDANTAQQVQLQNAVTTPNSIRQMQITYPAMKSARQIQSNPVMESAQPIDHAVTESVQPMDDSVTESVQPMDDLVTESAWPMDDSVTESVRPMGNSAVQSAWKPQTRSTEIEPVQRMQTAAEQTEFIQQPQTASAEKEFIQQPQTASAEKEFIQQPQMDHAALDSAQGKQTADDFLPAGQQHNESGIDTQVGGQKINPEYPLEHTGMKALNSVKNINMETENANIKLGYSGQNADIEAGQEFSPEYINSSQEHSLEYTDYHSEYQQQNSNLRVDQEYLSENSRRVKEPEFENEQDNLVLASKPRFLTQAQLQAESFMDERKAIHISRTDSEDMGEIKKLTLEQKEIFSYFVPIAGMEAQIYDLLAGVSEHLQYDKHAQSGNIIIEGISGSGKTVLIMDIIKVLQKEIKRPAGKTGKIDANALNQKDLDVLIEKISGGCLIIESASKISRETAVRLSRCMENDHAGTLYIIEDTPEGIQKALERDSSFAAKFTEKISIPLFSPDELIEFGKAYANDLNYDIDEMGVLALYKRIGAIQKLDHVTTLTEVKEIVDEAIENAEKGVLKKVFGMLTATRANDDNYIILREKDFEE